MKECPRLSTNGGPWPRGSAQDRAASAQELVGLWKAKRWFGPDARTAFGGAMIIVAVMIGAIATHGTASRTSPVCSA
jgi:hypothetical protein